MKEGLGLVKYCFRQTSKVIFSEIKGEFLSFLIPGFVKI